MTITNGQGWLGMALAGVLAACGGGQNTGDGVKTQTLTDQPPVTYEEAPAATGEGAGSEEGLEDHLEFAEMTLYEGTTPMLKIHADGTTELAQRLSDPSKAKAGEVTWEPGPQVKANGTIIYKEQQVARVNPDGSITNLRTNEKLPVTVSAEKVVTTQNGQELGLALAEDGNISLIGQAAPDPGKPVMKLEGATSPAHRKTALSLMGALFMGERK